MNFKFDSTKLLNGLSEINDKADIALMMFAENGALMLQNDARENAKWTDRTGHARQRLTGVANKTVNGYRLILSHGVNYGIWLELSNEKNFAIIEKTIRFTGSLKVVPLFERFMDKLK